MQSQEFVNKRVEIQPMEYVEAFNVPRKGRAIGIKGRLVIVQLDEPVLMDGKQHREITVNPCYLKVEKRTRRVTARKRNEKRRK